MKPPNNTVPLKLRLAQFASCVFRWKSLGLVNFTFGLASGNSVLARNFHGFTLRLTVARSVFHKLLFLEGDRAAPEYAILKQLVQPGMRVFDVGANIGYYLLMFERLLQGRGEVVCFEPEPDNFIELSANAAVNGFKNVELFRVACGEDNGTIGLIPGLNGRIAPGSTEFTTPIKPLDAWAEDRVDFIKIDVEGYEGVVLKGAVELLKRWKPILFLEYHPHIVGKYGHNFDTVITPLKTQYPVLEYYTIERSATLLDKVRIRYLGQSPFNRISDPITFEKSVQHGAYRDIFWVVCRQPC